MTRQSRVVAVMLVLTLCLASVACVLVGCRRTVGEPTQVSVRMKWFFAGSMTGWFAGKSEGIFEEHRIDLTINPGGPNNNSIKLVAAGTDLFGVTGADELLIARSKGIPVVALAVLFKRNPVCFIAKRAKKITSPADFRGKTIEVVYGENTEVQYRALLDRFGVSKKEVKEVPYTFNLIPFLEDKVDVSPAYIMDQAVRIRELGHDIVIIHPSDYGIDPYGDVVFVTERTIEENPDLVERFLAAFIESWLWTRDNPTQAVLDFVKAVPQLKEKEQVRVLEVTLPLVFHDDPTGNQLGIMDPARWAETQDLLLKYQVVQDSVDVAEAYADSFLEAAHHRIR